MSATSERRIAANRLNARKSTGPRTPRGKARSALNALKSGVSARTPLLPGECPVELEEFIEEIIDELAPRTPMERELADRIAGLCWRRRRLWRAEEEAILEGCDGPALADLNDPEEVAATMQLQSGRLMEQQFNSYKDGSLVRIGLYERRLSGGIDAALRLLLKLQDRREKREREGDEVEDEAPAQNKPIEPETPDDPREMQETAKVDDVAAATPVNAGGSGQATESTMPVEMNGAVDETSADLASERIPESHDRREIATPSETKTGETNQSRPVADPAPPSPA